MKSGGSQTKASVLPYRASGVAAILLAALASVATDQVNDGDYEGRECTSRESCDLGEGCSDAGECYTCAPECSTCSANEVCVFLYSKSGCPGCGLLATEKPCPGECIGDVDCPAGTACAQRSPNACNTCVPIAPNCGGGCPRDTHECVTWPEEDEPECTRRVDEPTCDNCGGSEDCAADESCIAWRSPGWTSCTECLTKVPEDWPDLPPIWPGDPDGPSADGGLPGDGAPGDAEAGGDSHVTGD